MTNTEAINELERQKMMFCHNCVHPQMVGWCENHCWIPEAYDMAISALQVQEKAQELSNNSPELDSEFGDLISRKAAIDAIKALYEWHDTVTEDRTIDHLKRLPPAQPEKRTHERTETHACDCISRQAAIDALDKRFDSIPMEQTTEILQLRKDLRKLPSAQPERTCVNCGRTVNNGGWYADGGTRCPIEEHYALPKDGYCHLWEKRNVTDDDYPERREE